MGLTTFIVAPWVAMDTRKKKKEKTWHNQYKRSMASSD